MKCALCPAVTALVTEIDVVVLVAAPDLEIEEDVLRRARTPEVAAIEIALPHLDVVLLLLVAAALPREDAASREALLLDMCGRNSMLGSF